ncbi:hypothetical protein NA56DRAFT_748087 [Hyaloscypha hepaticicola]|uniref:Uncharacterized protein n=1 Tax=Hyaloscypha hepaticicola TaxID=2082293 RepID=A0A2J6Q7Q0_9HELO|nr:hypothetical protein NA56DRAFT_748087 [Hyaloscypha hepaticicola]
MPFQFTFANGAQMTGWDVAMLQLQPPAQRRAAYQALWGTPQACPDRNVACPEEQLRHFCWPHKTNSDVRQGTQAKCYSCRHSNAPMPVGTEKPLGMDNENLLPCGCEWKLVTIELLVKYRVNSLLIYNQNGQVIGNNLIPAILNTPHRTVL